MYCRLDYCRRAYFTKEKFVLLVWRVSSTTSFCFRLALDYGLVGLSSVVHLLLGIRGDMAGAVGRTGENRAGL